MEVKSLGFFVVRLQANSIQVVICTPTVIGEKSDGSNPLDTDLDAYSAVIRRLANEENCALVDLRTAFMDYLRLHKTGLLFSGLEIVCFTLLVLDKILNTFSYIYPHFAFIHLVACT